MNVELGYILAGIATLMWGVVVIPVKHARTPGHLGVAVSMPVGVAVLLILSAILQREPIGLSRLWSWPGAALLLAGVFQFPLATTCYYESVRLSELSTVTPLTRVKTIMVALIVVTLGIEDISLSTAAACLIAVLGAVVLTYHQRSLSGRDRSQLRRGIGFVLLTCLCWAVGDVLMKAALESFAPLPATLIALCAGCVLYSAVAILRRQFGAICRMPRRDKLLYAVHGVLSFGVAYFALFASFTFIGVTRASVITTAWPAIPIVLGLTIYRERITLAKTFGIILIIVSVLLVVMSK